MEKTIQFSRLSKSNCNRKRLSKYKKWSSNPRHNKCSHKFKKKNCFSHNFKRRMKHSLSHKHKNSNFRQKMYSNLVKKLRFRMKGSLIKQLRSNLNLKSKVRHSHSQKLKQRLLKKAKLNRNSIKDFSFLRLQWKCKLSKKSVQRSRTKEIDSTPIACKDRLGIQEKLCLNSSNRCSN